MPQDQVWQSTGRVRVMAQHTIDFRYALDESWTSIGRPDDPYKTLVDQKGRLLYRRVHEGVRCGVFRFDRVVSFGLQTRHKPISIAQHTEDARTPVVFTQVRYPHATLTLRSVGHRYEGDLRTDLSSHDLWEALPSRNTPFTDVW